ncbi:MAG: hydroxysqualene dehydroxylase HpnE [Phycisphaeraceae bacterium]|nr:hydroxysqualene dehydroxylase HpnE [Phycisphaeraceae bacterium]
MSRPSVAVLIVGGGIAGIAAAVRLAEQGIRVTLLETRKKLGGRATSFTDVRTGRVLDNCQHVMLGCCTNYADLLARLDASTQIRWYREQYWIEAGGRLSVIRPGPLPAPLQFSGSFLAAKFLTIREVAAIGRACASILRADRAKHDNETFGAFLARHGQGESLIRKFWSPVIVSACNMEVDRVSAGAAMHVFQEGFLANARAADIGVPAVPLVRLYDRAEAAISSRGEIVLGAGVERLDARSATTTDGRTFEADRVVCALPVERVNRVVDEAIRVEDPRFSTLDDFAHSPILGVHLEFDRPVLEQPHAVLVERSVQWLFRKDDDGKSLHAVISAADDWMPLDEQQIADRVLADVRACLPAAAAATLLSARSVKEKRATFAPVPGLAARRPAAAPSSSGGLILAGDYTATGWPATMEGATRSGYAAAAAVLGLPAESLLVPSLPLATLARVLSRGRVESATL